MNGRTRERTSGNGRTTCEKTHVGPPETPETEAATIYKFIQTDLSHEFWNRIGIEIIPKHCLEIRCKEIKVTYSTIIQCTLTNMKAGLIGLSNARRCQLQIQTCWPATIGTELLARSAWWEKFIPRRRNRRFFKWLGSSEWQNHAAAAGGIMEIKPTQSKASYIR